MSLSWNEVRDRAIKFTRQWVGETSERAEAKTFWDEFFDVFGLQRRTVASFEEPVRNLKGQYNFIDLFWRGVLLGEHKSLGQNLGKAESQAGTTNWMTWDILGHLTGIILPSHQNDTNDPPNMIPRVISFNPNELGWVRQITYPDNTYETFAFDAVGNVTNHVDVAGRTNRFTWLPTRKLASTVRYLTSGGSNQAATVGLDYDQQMNVVNVKDELGRGVETYQLDLQDRPTSVTNVENQVMSMTWGLKDMVSSMVRFDTSSISFAYDEGARVKQITYPDAVLSFTYFKNGLAMTASNGWGTISNTYDGANRLTSQTQPVPSGNVAYGYYPAGQVSNVVSVAGTNIYTLDAGDRLQTLSVSSLGRQDAVTYSRDPVSGTLTGASYSNGIHCAYSYDLMDRLTGISWADVSNKVLRSRSYTYTAAGLISDITFETSEKAIYSYDSLDRLTREKHTDYYGQVISDEKYDYDLAGNRTKKTVLDSAGADLVTVNYSLAAGNKLGSWTVAETNLSARFAVIGNSSDPIGTNDRFGQLWVSNSASAVVKPTVSGTNFFAFDLTVGMGTQTVHAAIRDVAGNTSYVTNRFYPTCLTNGTYQYSTAGSLTNRQYSGKDYTETLALTWNGQYQLTAAFTNGALAEAFGYDGAGRRIFIAEGGTTNWMVYDGDQMVAEVDGIGNLKKSYVYEGLDRTVSMTTYDSATNTYYFIRDHLGSTLALTDGSGNIIESYRYDAWGRVLGVYNASGNQIDESAVGNRILWQGREYSFKTGLYYFRARHYDPGMGRWLSNDPIGISGGLNQYVFCGNNPINFRDPSGLCKESGGSGNALVDTARAHVGSYGWNVWAWNSWRFRTGTPKCNEFVFDMILEAGYPNPSLPTDPNSPGGRTRPPTANEWNNSGVTIPGWTKPHPNPLPGDIVGNGVHVGIQTEVNTRISAALYDSVFNRNNRVVENQWGEGNAGRSPVFPDSRLK